MAPSSPPTATQAARGRIDGVQFGPEFLVVEGWAALPQGGAATLAVGGVEHPIPGFFARADLGAAPVAFTLDVPRSASAGGDDVLELRSGGQVLARLPLAEAGFRSFRPSGAIDHASSETVSGWAFDPGLWFGKPPPGALHLMIGPHQVPVSLAVGRGDLPFSAARAGRAMGFRIDPAAALGAEAIAALRSGAGADVRLVSKGFQVAQKPLVFVDPPATAPSRRGGRAASEPSGAIAFRAWSPTLGGWLLGGTIQPGDGPRLPAEADMLVDGRTEAHGHFAVQVKGASATFLGFVAAPEEGVALDSLLVGRREPVRLRAAAGVRTLGETEAVQAMRATLGNLPDAAEHPLAALLRRPIYEGVDTLATLGRGIRLELDEVLEAPGAGLLLGGWLADPTGEIATIRIRAGAHASPPLAERWLPIPRADVAQALKLDRLDVGFRAFAALPGIRAGEAFLEVTLRDGTTAFRPLAPATREGRAGIVRSLVQLPVEGGEAARAIPVLAPALAALNRAAAAPTMIEHGYGRSRPDPRVSLVIPLGERLDRLAYQAACFSALPPADEYIFVVPDRGAAEAAKTLATSAYRRFALPFRLLVAADEGETVAARNAGLRAARGTYLCWMAPDVVPRAGDALGALVDALERDSATGVVGAQLLYEDDTIQHAGIAVEPAARLDGLLAPTFPRRGRVAEPDVSAEPTAISGALMLLRRDLALELGGLDAAYTQPDFADADFCLRLRERGRTCLLTGPAFHNVERPRAPSIGLEHADAWTFTRRWGGSAA